MDGWLVAVKTPKQDEDAPHLLCKAHMLELCQHSKIITLHYIIAIPPHGLVVVLFCSNLLDLPTASGQLSRMFRMFTRFRRLCLFWRGRAWYKT